MNNEEQNQVLRQKQAQQIIRGQEAHALKFKEYKTSTSDGVSVGAQLNKPTAFEYQLPDNVMKLRKISPQATRISLKLGQV